MDTPGQSRNENGVPIWPRALRDQNPRLLGPALEVERGVEVRYFVCGHVSLLLAAEARGEEKGGPVTSPSMPPPRTRGDGAPATVLRMLRAAAAGRHVVWRGDAMR